jgi:hypothetical protein
MRMNPTQCEHNWISGPTVDQCDQCRIYRLFGITVIGARELTHYGYGHTIEDARKDLEIKRDRLLREAYGT